MDEIDFSRESRYIEVLWFDGFVCFFLLRVLIESYPQSIWIRRRKITVWFTPVSIFIIDDTAAISEVDLNIHPLRDINSIIHNISGKIHKKIFNKLFLVQI